MCIGARDKSTERPGARQMVIGIDLKSMQAFPRESRIIENGKSGND